MAVPYTFATATSSIPLSQLDANFATGITLGNTTVYLGNTTTSIGNLTLTNATISSVASTFPNSYLANSSVTIGSTNVSLGGTATTIAGLTLTSPTITGGTSTATQNLANVTGTLAVGNGGTGLTTLTAGYIPFGNGTSVFGSNAGLFWDNTNFRLGVGTSSPINLLNVYNGISADFFTTPQVLVGTTLTSPGFTNALQVISPNSIDTDYLSAYNIGGGNNIGTNLLIANAGRGGTAGTVKYILGLDAPNGQAITAAIGTASNHPFTIGTNSTERMRIDTSGNLGLGVTPSAWGNTFNAIQIGARGSVWSSTSSGSTFLSQNTYYNAGFKYIATAASSNYEQGGGGHYWYTAPSGTAGNAITFTQAMTLDNSGNLGIGTTSPSTKLYVSGTGSLATFGGNSSSNVVPDIQIVRSSSGTGIQTGPNITFSDSTTNNTCTIQNSQGSLTFWNYGSSAWNERMRIDSSGNLLVGTTTSGGVGYTLLYNASGPTWINNWSVDGGTHASFRTAGVQKGYIATSGGVTIYSTTSDERAKENIEPSASALQSILDTEIVSFDFKDKSGHTNYGGIAQRLLNTIPETIFVPKNPDEMMGVDWSKAVPRLIKSIQEQQAIIESLTQRIATLENK